MFTYLLDVQEVLLILKKIDNTSWTYSNQIPVKIVSWLMLTGSELGDKTGTGHREKTDPVPVLKKIPVPDTAITGSNFSFQTKSGSKSVSGSD